MKNREEIVSAFKQCGLPGACMKCKYGAEKEGCYAALKHDVLELIDTQRKTINELERYMNVIADAIGGYDRNET